LIKLVIEKGLNIFEPQMFVVKLASQLVRRKFRNIAKKLYNKIMDKIIIIDEIDYDLLLDIALLTDCKSIDALYIATTSLI